MKHKLSISAMGDALHALRLASNRILHLLWQVGKRRHKIKVVTAARKPVIYDPDDFIVSLNFAPYRDLEQTPTEQGESTSRVFAQLLRECETGLVQVNGAGPGAPHRPARPIVLAGANAVAPA
ncbi:MAG: hypothetical protein ACYC4S_09885 [Rhodoferax sp.]